MTTPLHPRRVIREAVVAELTGATSAGARVTKTKVDPHRKGELPAISVYTLSEPVDPASKDTAPRELTRDVKVEVTGWVAHTADLPVDDAMDALALEIETVMDADRYLSGAAYESILESTDMEVIRDGDPLVGIVTLTYSVTYLTSPAVGTLDDFLRAGVTTQIVGAGADNAAHDVVVVQETGGFSFGFDKGFE